MGYYININSKGQYLTTNKKYEELIADGARPIPKPQVFKDNLVCVVENGPFDAAAYAFSGEEMRRFTYPRNDMALTRWLEYDYAKALAQ